MTRCRWCGMESQDPYVCEWCKRVMATGAPAPPGYKPPTAPTPSSDPTVMTPPPAPTPPSPTTPSDITATPMGPTPPPVQATPAGGTPPPVQATPMAPPGAPRPVPTTTALPPGQVRILYEVHEGLPFHLRLERFLAVVLPLAAINVLIISQRPEWAIWSNPVYFFILGMWMPGSHLIGTIDDTEDYRDVALVMLMSLFCCGPVATLVLYFIASGLLALILKTDINWSLIGLLLAYTLARIMFDLVLILIDFEEIADFVRIGFSFWDFLLLVPLFGGWLLGGMVRSD
jgi:hypothetical protein